VAPLLISTTQLPDAVAGAAYATALGASGGTTPYLWSLRNGALPPGLTLDGVTGIVSGTPSAVGSYAFSVDVRDTSSPQQTATAGLRIIVSAPLVVSTTSLPNAIIGVAYHVDLVAGGGLAPYTWSVVGGALPPGLTLRAGGFIDGTATVVGSFAFSVRVTDGSSPSQSASASLSITVTPPLSIRTMTLPEGTVSVAYSAQLDAIGGNLPYTWSLRMGSLPPGLTLGASTGIIGGTPTTPGTYDFAVRVTDSSNPRENANRMLSIVVTPSGPTITTASLPGGVTGTLYGSSLSASGGSTPYAWAIAAGTLPAGLSLDPVTGAISGTPSAVGTFTFTVRVTDAAMDTATRTFSIVIAAPLVITTMSLPDGVARDPYAATLTASGGILAYAWSITSGALPAGLTLNAATGGINGIPTTPGVYTFTVRVQDAASPRQSATLALSITVGDRLRITTNNIPNARLGQTYATALNASGGDGALTWSIVAGGLPPGVTLDAVTGIISGTPGGGGNYPFTVSVTDSGTPQQQTQAQFTLRVR